MRLLKSLFAALVLVGLGACQSEGEPTGGSADAVTAGAAWRSPIAAGIYDDQHGTRLVVDGDPIILGLTQSLGFYGANHELCSGSADIAPVGSTVDKAVLVDDEMGCKLTLFAPDRNHVRVVGTVAFQGKTSAINVTLEALSNGGLDGSYDDPARRARLTIAGQTAESLVASFEADDQTVFEGMKAVRIGYGTEYYQLEAPSGCAYRVTAGWALDGSKYVTVSETRPQASCVPGTRLLELSE